MKKVLVLLLLVTFMASPVLFADVTVGGWGRIIMSVMGTDAEDSEVTMDMSPNWGGDGGRVRFSIKGSAEQIGFQFDVDGNATLDWGGSSMAVAEVLCIWFMPIEMLKLTAGKFQIDSLRGKFGGKSAASDTLYVGGGDFEDNIFARNRFSHGLCAELTPIDGLTINAGIQFEKPDPADIDPDDGTDIIVANAEETFKTIQFAVGYEIPGIGLARAQYIGLNPMGTIFSDEVQFAFALNAVDGLLVDVGVRIDVADVAEPDDPVAALGASYKVNDQLSVTLLADAMFSDPLLMFVGLQGSYGLEMMDVRLETGFHVEEDANVLLIYPYVRKSLGNGYASLGFKLNMNMTVDAEVMTWSIPAVFEYWF